MEKFAFWKESIELIYEKLKCRPDGLSQQEASARLKTYGPNSLKPKQRGKTFILLLSQFKNPLVLLLIGAAILSFSLGGKTDAIIICVIVGLSGVLGFVQERGAIHSLEELLRMVETKAMVKRDGKEEEIPLDLVVPGDLVILNAGDIIPADCYLIESNRLYIDEATLTGESMPVEKGLGVSEEKKNALFMGTVVASGIGKAIVVATGKTTEFGNIAEKTRFRPPETAFEIGVKKFGFFLLTVTLVLVGTIFGVNVVLKRSILESFLFALALAVGLTPQLLPAIISVNLAHGARRMAKKHVIIKRLASIENFGQMNVLCADKTGTITVGKIELDRVAAIDGNGSEKGAFFSFLNASMQTSYTNPLDQALLEKLKMEKGAWNRVDEIPYDFQRRRLSVIVENEGKELILVKGAVPELLGVCSRAEQADGSVVSIEEKKEAIQHYFEEESSKGFRTIGVAYGEGRNEENLIFLGFLHFLDPVKPDIAKVVEELMNKGVRLKIITGDFHSVALHIATLLNMPRTDLITGREIDGLSEEELIKTVKQKHVFAEIDPAQKEKIIAALQKGGHVVGYLGDGVNDVAALHHADVGIAVNTGADAAKEASDIILLEHDLSVLRAGIEEGRITFVNTLKYVYMATSANFGNMFSMAGASLFLNFLPLLPKQVLLTNLLTDFPEMAIATDRVLPETVVRPVKWDLPFIRKFMIVFGLISSIYDYITFGALLFFLKADEVHFQTGWFIESVVSATLIVLAIRTRRPLYGSRPGRLLAFSVFAVAIGTLFIPYTPLGKLFGFVPLPLYFYGVLAGIVILYILTVEIAKRFFFHHHH